MATLVQWDDAIRDTVYTPDQAGRPVFLDMEDDVLLAAARRAGLDTVTAEEAEADLVRAVKDHLSISGTGTKKAFGSLSQFSKNRPFRIFCEPPSRRCATAPSPGPADAKI